MVPSPRSRRTMTDNGAEHTRQDSAELEDGALAEAVTREREARKERRRLERERQRAAVEERLPKRIYTDLTTVSGAWDTRSQREASTSARLDMQTETRRIVSSIALDGALRTEVFVLVDGEWRTLGAIALDAPTA